MVMHSNIRLRAALLLAGLMLSPSAAFAQAEPQTNRPATAEAETRRGFIGLGIGPSRPIGSFADTYPDNPKAGLAKPGYTDTFLNVGYRFGKHFGVAVAFSYSESMMRDGGDDDWWQVAVITAGPMYSRPLGARSALDLKAMVGMMALTPVVDSFGTDDDTGAGLAIDVRATVRYDVFRRWAVFAEGGLQSSNVSFISNRRTDVRQLTSGFGIAFRPAWH